MGFIRGKLHDDKGEPIKVLLLGKPGFCFGRPTVIRPLPESTETLPEGLTFDELKKLVEDLK